MVTIFSRFGMEAVERVTKAYIVRYLREAPESDEGISLFKSSLAHQS